jgi:hypothetical protein
VKRRAPLALLLLALAVPGAAQQQLTRWTVDGGGGRSQGPRWTVTGTVGQPDAVPLLYGGQWRLGGGFWADPGSMIFRDGFEED